MERSHIGQCDGMTKVDREPVFAAALRRQDAKASPEFGVILTRRVALSVGLAAVILVLASCASLPGGSIVKKATTSPRTASSPSGAPHTLIGAFPAAPDIKVPFGFDAQVYARGLKDPTAMAFGPDGRLYVAEQGGEIVTVAPDSSSPVLFAAGYPTPLGLAWLGHSLFVSAQGQLDSIQLVNGAAAARRTILSGLPYGEHQQDGVAVAPDGRLYIGSGSTCDACAETSSESAAILTVNPDGTGLQVVASGLRNPYGLAVQPSTGQLYADVNGQDNLGSASDPEPADMLVAVKAGAQYGWPRCWPDARLLDLQGQCQGVTPPAAYLAPHAAPAGMSFYGGTTYPSSYQGNLFIAEWGSNFPYGNTGHVVVRVVLGVNGSAPISRVSVFASGFQHPIGVVNGPGGALLVADSGTGVIYRIQASGHR